MATSANGQARGAVAAAGLILLAVTPARWVAQAALAADALPVVSSASIVTGGGVTLRSINLSFPNSHSTFPGAGADAINNDCLICHSAAMVLDQANLSRAEWQDIVDQMRNDFKAPFAAGDTPAIVDYLANLKKVMSQSVGRQPDAKHGAVIAAQGTPTGSPPCSQCHAFNGASDATGAFPRIAGQSADYLAKQLRDFASGVRTNPLMTPIAKALAQSPGSVADVAAYYASQNAPFPPLKSGDPAVVKRGEDLAKSGGPDGLHCDNCHGPDGRGAPPVIPYLGGQYAHYIAFTLQMWQEGFRKNSPDAMAVIAKTLDDQDVAAVAAYYQQLGSSQATMRPR